jgi:hypothetical protein
VEESFERWDACSMRLWCCGGDPTGDSVGDAGCDRREMSLTIVVASCEPFPFLTWPCSASTVAGSKLTIGVAALENEVVLIALGTTGLLKVN